MEDQMTEICIKNKMKKKAMFEIVILKGKESNLD